MWERGKNEQQAFAVLILQEGKNRGRISWDWKSLPVDCVENSSLYSSPLSVFEADVPGKPVRELNK